MDRICGTLLQKHLPENRQMAFVAGPRQAGDTTSARMDYYRRGGDSLMGRYFLYRMHPVTLSELVRHEIDNPGVHTPERPEPQALDTLLRFGGFPEPFLRQSVQFYNQ